MFHLINFTLTSRIETRIMTFVCDMWSSLTGKMRKGGFDCISSWVIAGSLLWGCLVAMADARTIGGWSDIDSREPQGVAGLISQSEERHRADSGNQHGTIYPADYPGLLKPRLKRRGDIEQYLKQLRRARQSGRVILEFTIDARGRPRDISVIRPSGVALLDQAAIEAIRRSRWFPGQLDHHPVPVRMMASWRHQLPGSSAPSLQQLLRALTQSVRRRPHSLLNRNWTPRLDQQAEHRLNLAQYYVKRHQWARALDHLIELYTTAESYSRFDVVLHTLTRVVKRLNRPRLAKEIRRQRNEWLAQHVERTGRSAPDRFHETEVNHAAVTTRRHQDAVEQELSPTIPREGASGGEPSILTLTADLVNVPVIVRDSEGRYIADLKKSDFALFEDGRRQQIVFFATTDEPLTVALLIDTSLSTKSQFHQLQEAAIGFMEQLRPTDHVVLVAFGDEIRTTSRPAADSRELAQAVRALTTGTTTRLYDAVMLTLIEHLNSIRGRRAIVLLTDGYDSASTLIDRDGVLELVAEVGAPVYIVAYDTQKLMERLAREQSAGDELNERLLGLRRGYASAKVFLRQLARLSGGRLYRADHLTDLSATFFQILLELRHLYSLGYYPNNPPRSGRFHTIHIKVNREGAQVHTRAGYFH
ncbi:MAG: VWA domain-containing protein [Acidobacteria bacterium]|nr:MAG: VWA domain-containing protein [Acidobacteriota bacterium]